MRLSVCVITYNHGEYIEQAITSILNQKVSFDYEIVVGEDCSTDFDSGRIYVGWRPPIQVA